MGLLPRALPLSDAPGDVPRSDFRRLPMASSRPLLRVGVQARLQGIEPALELIERDGGELAMAEPDAIIGIDDQGGDVGHARGARPATGQERAGAVGEL